MSRRRATLLIAVVLGILCVPFVLWERQALNHAVGFEFICATNVPGLLCMSSVPGSAPHALFKITNRTHHLIICQGYGYLDEGESGMLPVCIPAGTGPWRTSVLWQRREFNWFEVLVNRLEYHVIVAFRLRQCHQDPWLQLEHVSYSAEIQR